MSSDQENGENDGAEKEVGNVEENDTALEGSAQEEQGGVGGAVGDERATEAESMTRPHASPELARIAELEQLNADYYDRYIRSVAELENFKKRAIKERSELLRYAGEALARDLLEGMDSLELAVAHGEKQGLDGPAEEFLKGVKLVLDKFVSILNRHEIAAEDAKGKDFDPAKHEALTSVPTADVAPGVIMEEFRKAYFYRDKLLRPAQVVVAQAIS